ncbi:MAG: alpha/beta fold hydrolase [Solirubrobacterales bacterium]|nr:alpha/beta fold hydrolase [Solirubrobacterales bacterium]
MTELTLFHGFSQDPSVWDQLSTYLPSEWKKIAPTLPGHDQHSLDLPLDAEDFAIKTLDRLSPQPASGKRVLMGYSLGSRLALDLVLREPERWTHLILVSSGAGLTDPTARAERRATDGVLADRLESEGLDAFSNTWDAQPIWTGDPEETRAKRRQMISTKTAAGLAAAIRAYGQGTAPSFWDQLENIVLPTTVVIGSRDRSYSEVARRMAAGLNRCAEPITVEAGHSVPLEAPEALADAIISQLAS